MKPELSVVIPAFNEAERIPSTLHIIDDYLRNRSHMYEIIVVDDGSRDKTCEAALNTRIQNLTVLSLEKNTGKGAAVRKGMCAAQGAMRLFMDADGSTHIRELEKLESYLRCGYDIVIGSRRAPGASIVIRQNIFRDFLGSLWRALVSVVVPVGFHDTQNGFKLFSEKATQDIFPELHTAGWSFDIEILLLAKHKSLHVKEVPIIWTNSHYSRMTIGGMARMAIDLWSIRSRLGKGTLQREHVVYHR